MSTIKRIHLFLHVNRSRYKSRKFKVRSTNRQLNIIRKKHNLPVFKGWLRK